MAENDFLTGYLSGQNEGGNKGGMFGGGGWEGLLGLIVIASLFGYGNFGNGRNGGGGSATQADVNWGFQFNDLQGSLRGITNGISDATYALNNSINNGFYGVDRSLCNIGHQISDCCCATQRAIDGVNYNMATSFANLQNTMCGNTRDIIDAQNAGTRAILDFLTTDKINTLTAENQNLKFQASQARQNDYLTAAMDANVATILRRTGHDCPTAAYLVQPPTAINFPTNGCGTVQFGNWGNGWGCGCGCAA